MASSTRSLQRGLALLLGLVLALASAFFPTSLPAARARPLSFEALLPVARGSAGLSSPITSFDQRARAAYAAGNGTEAASLWLQAAEAARNNGDNLLQARLLSNLALAQLLQGKVEEAQSSLNAGFALLDAPNQSANTPLNRSRAQLLHAQARLHFDRGQMQSALASWRQVEPLYRQLGARDAELASRINQAEALHGLGFLSEARTLLESTLQQPDLSAQPRLKATALASLAAILQRQDKGEEAKALAAQLRDLAEARDRDPFASQQAILTLANIDSCNNTAKPVRQAFQQDAANPGISSLQANASRLAMLLKCNPPEYTLIDKIWPKLLDEVNKLPGNAAALDLRLNLASSLSLLRQRKVLDPSIIPTETKLRLLLERSQLDADRLGNGRASSLASGELGSLALSAGRLKEAEVLTEKALQQSLALRMPELSSRWLWQLGSIFSKQPNRSAALTAYQQALTELTTLSLDLASASPADPSSFRKSLEPISREFIDQLTKSPAATDEDRNNARRVMEELQVAELNDFFRLPCFTTSPISSRKDPNLAIVYPMLLPDRLEVIVYLPGTRDEPPLHHSQLIDKGKLEQTITRLQDQLQKRPASPKSPDFFLKDAQDLYRWLLAPFEKQLQDRKISQLVFVPDVVLRNLPMAVLHDGNDYLGSRYAIAVAPGMLLTPSTRRPGTRPRVLGAGLSESNRNTGNLPFVVQELEELRNSTGATTLINSTFTKQALRKELQSGDYSVVHLATHAKFGSKPSNTSLEAYDGEIDVNQLSDILQSSQRRTGNSLDLLILSACDGAKDDTNANLGLAAVAARSGASSTIASLWQVGDDATAQLMASFYRHWLRDSSQGPPITKAQALRLAQNDLRRVDEFSHPYYWSAFTLLGDWT